MPQRRSQDASRPASKRSRARRSRPKSGDRAVARESRADELALVISLEAVLWAGLLVGAFALRLARLDALPLGLEESSRAFAAFQVSEGSVPDGWSGDLASALTALLFAIFDEGEALARIVPAIAGGALVGAFWFTGRYLGRGAALAAATLIALSPLTIIASRSGLAFSLGALLSLTMVASLFAYIREQRPLYLAAFVGSLALAPTVDAVATGTAIAVAAFLLVEGALRGEQHIARAFGAFRAEPQQQGIAAGIAAGALLLGLSHFGTTLDRVGFAGLTQWGDMFGSPGDGRDWAYVKLLAGYDWPLTLAGGLGLLLGARRLLVGGRDVSLFQRLVLLWSAIAVVTAALTTRHESGQLLILLLPFSLLAGTLVEEAVTTLDWSALRRWWLPLVAVAVLTAFAFLILTEWSQGRASGSDKFYMVLALLVAGGLIVSAFPALGRSAIAVGVTAVAVLAAVFLVHSSLSVVLSDGDEFAVDSRADENIEGLVITVAGAAAEREGVVLVDPSLREPLEWYLRDQPLAFGDPSPEAAVYIAPPEAAAAGFVAEGPPRLVAEGWYPSERDLLKAWRWLSFRTSFGNLSSIDAQVFLPEP